MTHIQSYVVDNTHIDCHADSSYDEQDYSKRKEDFDKLMHIRLKTDLKDISDDAIFGPYNRDKDGVKLIGDVSMNKQAEESYESFKNLCKYSELENFLIEINYK